MKKRYAKPAVILEKDIEALAGTCAPGDGNTGGIEKTTPSEKGCEDVQLT
ncbi:hypothetical protein ACFLU6_04320 [Acidobacteriota bacterium]